MALLADLVLADLPIEALLNIKAAIDIECKRRHHAADLQRQQMPNEKMRRFGAFTPSLSYEEALLDLGKNDVSNPAAIPRDVRMRRIEDRMRYLPILLAQNWKPLFPDIDRSTSPRHFYVYAHIDPRKKTVALDPLSMTLNGEPFYVGKGCGKRAWDLKRNQAHGKRIKLMREAGYEAVDMVALFAKNLFENEALILEAKLIYFFGSIYEEGLRGFLVNLEDQVRPTFEREMRKLPSLQEYLAVQKKIVSKKSGDIQ